ncbi:MAG: sodium:proton antiporter NhaD [Gammaproteobacteria bacterium]|nr:MAG: sodium:proton antiporter NhaD [Gammaproteobacteria bacterium]
MFMNIGVTVVALALLPQTAWAVGMQTMGLTDTTLGYVAVAVFVAAYVLVAAEEFNHLRKSKPMILGAGIIWVLVALIARQHDVPQDEVELALERNLADYAGLFLFLLVAMTYVNTLTERNLFSALRAWLIHRKFSYRKIFWLTGILAFFISPVADNLTTALLLGAVVMAVGSDEPRFIPLASINIVVAANAGGAFSPFGDITTLMVWEAQKVPTSQFLLLFIPSAVNFLIPAAFMHFSVPAGSPEVDCELIKPKPGTYVICGLFLLTIATALSFEQLLGLPPYLGMMTGFSYLLFYAYYLKSSQTTEPHEERFNIFSEIARAEWDTLLFFFGVIFCVGGLSYIGYLELASATTYGALGPTEANVLAGILSAIVDNIPVMFGILTMDPAMDVAQWLLVCLTVGVGGSMLSIGSAAGVALMGQSRGHYSFFAHLRWSWAILLGYAGSIWVHYHINMAP